jgi:hypothetical protein
MGEVIQIPGDGSSSVTNLVSFPSNPTVNDDYNAGYRVGYLWLNTSGNILWQCIDHTPGAAVWVRINSVVDMQFDFDTVLDTTTATGANWDDLLSLITSDEIGEDATYVCIFNGSVNNSNNNKSVSCRIVIDGVVQADSVRTAKQTSGGFDMILSTITCEAGVAANKEIKVQWQVSAFTGSVTGRTLQIIGFPNSIRKT